MDENIWQTRGGAGACVAPSPEDLKELVRLLLKYAPHDDGFELGECGVRVFRTSHIQDVKTHVFSQPSICIVPQGTKTVDFSHGTCENSHSKMVIYAAEIPINMRVSKASQDEPYLCMVIPIDPQHLNEMVRKVFPKGVPAKRNPRAVYVGNATSHIYKLAIRVMSLIESQRDADLLVPLAIDEMLIRLLRSAVGVEIAQLGIVDSHTSKIAKAIAWIKEHYKETIKVENVAKLMGMSVSSFHTHFKSITGMSPLKYQKVLRLQKARDLLQTDMISVSRAAYKVGYRSATQFSREYSREFGIAPSKDSVLWQGGGNPDDD